MANMLNTRSLIAKREEHQRRTAQLGTLQMHASVLRILAIASQFIPE